MNRTVSKATNLAYNLQSRFKDGEFYSLPEDMIRGTILNTIVKPDVIVNCTDKGADGALLEVSPFAAGTAGEFNNTLSIDNCRNLKNLNPDVVIVDIVLPQRGADNSIMLRHARDAALEHLVNGLGMVINQAAPAYKLVENAHGSVHRKSLSEEDIRKLMQQAAKSA